MSNDFYNPSGSPTTDAAGSSAVQRTEFASIAAGFAKLPGLIGNGLRAVVVNAGGTALTVTTGTLALAGNFATTGAFNTTLAQTASVSLTLPGVSGTLATLAGTEALTNKTYSGLTISTTTGTLAIAAGVTFTVSNSLTLAGTDGTTMTFPGTSASVARIDAGQTFSGTQAFGTLTATTVNGMTLTGSGTVNFGTGGTVLYTNATTTLSGDVTGSGTTSIATTVAKIAGVTVSGTTGTGNVVFSTSPTVTGISSNTFTSTVATGTAPFTVSSTTVVANLNAAQLNGATFASPGTIGGTVPGAATVTTLNTTTIASGAWNGTKIGLLYGGTNADLSATGGSNQFLKQTTVGGTVTVAAIVAADLPVMVGDSGSGGTKGAVPAPAAGDAAAGKFLKADATWAAVSGGVSSIADATNGGLSFSASTGAVTASIAPGDLASKGSPVGADLLVIGDSAASNAAKTSTITAVLALASSAPSGSVMPFAARVIPSGWLICDGSAVSRSTFASLFAAMCPSIGTFTVTLASPAVFTLTAHGLNIGERVRFSTTGALPTGLTANTDYFISAVPSSSTFRVSATLAGADVNTSVSQSGTHTAQYFGYGAGDGSTTFNVPDMRGRLAAGADAMGGTAASRLTLGGSGIRAGGLGVSGGVETTTLTTAQLASHSHAQLNTILNTGASNIYGTACPASVASVGGTTDVAGTGAAHQNTQPTLITNYIIKT